MGIIKLPARLYPEFEAKIKDKFFQEYNMTREKRELEHKLRENNNLRQKVNRLRAQVKQQQLALVDKNNTIRKLRLEVERNKYPLLEGE